MIKDVLGTLSKLDLSRLDGSDAARIASIFRDSARFDANQLTRQGRRLARRTGGYVAANPRRAGLGLGGVALLGLGAFAAYQLTRSKPETMLDTTDGEADKAGERPSVTMNATEAAT